MRVIIGKKWKYVRIVWEKILLSGMLRGMDTKLCANIVGKRLCYVMLVYIQMIINIKNVIGVKVVVVSENGNRIMILSGGYDCEGFKK